MEKISQHDSFWNDPKNAEDHLRKISAIKKWVTMFEAVETAVEDLKILHEFFEIQEATEQEVDTQLKQTISLIEDLEFKNMLGKEEDKLGAVVKINSGAGGTESLDWTYILMRQYIRWGEQNGYKIREMDYQAGDEAGVKSVTLQFEGDFAYGYLKSESGVHRLVRLSPFDANHKRHTTFASVFISPVVDDTIEIEINPADITWETYRSGGAGGQNVNKVNTKIELRFNIPASILLSEEEKILLMEKLKNRINSLGELIIVSQDDRSQLKNKENAISKFYQLLQHALTPQKMRKPSKPSMASRHRRLENKRRLSEKKKDRKPPEIIK